MGNLPLEGSQQLEKGEPYSTFCYEADWELLKHRKNFKGCSHHSLFKGHKEIVNIVILNFEQCNQCLKCQVSGHMIFKKSEKNSKNLKNLRKSEKFLKIWKISENLLKIFRKLSANLKIFRKSEKFLKIWNFWKSEISENLKNFANQSGHVSSLLWSNVSKVTGL